MSSFHHLFAELLEKTQKSDWRAQAAPEPPHSQSTSRTDVVGEARVPASPCRIRATPRQRNPRAFFASPLAHGAPSAAAETTHVSEASASSDGRVQSYQVVKEVALAFTLVALQETCCAQDEALTTTRTAAAATTAAAVLTHRASLQAQLQHTTQAFLHKVAQAEDDERTLVRDVRIALHEVCAATQRERDGGRGTMASTDRVRELHALIDEATQALCHHTDETSSRRAVPAMTPITRWAGHAHFNPITISVTTVFASSHRSSVQLPNNASAVVPLFLISDVVHQMSVYWRLHNEAEARARLHALRHKDASAYAEHVSLLKISALLQVMEKTHNFMTRIGENIKRRLDHAGSHTNSGSVAVLPEVVSTGPRGMDDGGGANGTNATDRGGLRVDASSEYQRFKAYVASANDDFKLIHPVDSFVASQPVGLKATLMPHQMDGLRFLTSLHTNHINGILADEMGVGKTIQTLAFLLHLKESLQRIGDVTDSNAFLRRYNQETRAKHHSDADRGGDALSDGCRMPPHLVLAPLSVVREWKEACEQFVPDSLRVALLSDLQDPLAEAPLYDILLVPIHAVRRLSLEVMRIQFGYIVVDEAHKAVANLHTQTAACILQLRYWRRLVLTGTPLNSDLQELWSLLHFLNPDVFSTQDSFEEVFRRPFAVYDAREMDLTSEERGLLVLRLHQILRPFMLRRTKRDIDQSLRIRFHTLLCPLTTMQSALLALMRTEKRTPSCALADDDTHASDEEDEEEEEEAAAASRSERTNSSQTDGRDAHVDVLTHAETFTEMHRAAIEAARVATRYGLTNSNVSESTAQAVCNHALALPFFSQVAHMNNLSEQTPARPMGFPIDPCLLPTCVADDGADTITPAPHTSLRTEVAEDRVVDESAETVGGPFVKDQATGTPQNAGDGACRGGAAEWALACSGKFLVLDLLLTRLAMVGRKAVLFTHWLDCLDLLADYLIGRGWGHAFEVLSGSTSEEDRKVRVHRFRSDPTCFFFLLSVKAGGCGINLQSAHVVIMLDRDYTTTNEDQALARVYRIGQRHTVRAVYLTTQDSAEARVATRAQTKNKPRQAIIEDGTYQVVGADPAQEDGEHVAAACDVVSDRQRNKADVNGAAEEGDDDIEESSSEPSTPALNAATATNTTLAMTLWHELARTAQPDDWTTLPSPLTLRQQEREHAWRQRATDHEAPTRTSLSDLRTRATMCAPLSAATSLTASRRECDLLRRAFHRLRTGYSMNITATTCDDAKGTPTLTVSVPVPEDEADEAEDARLRAWLRGRMTDTAWDALHRMVSELDSLVCTEEDERAGRLAQTLVPHRPPRDTAEFDAQWMCESANARRQRETTPASLVWHNAHGWGRVLLPWLDAVDGPGIFQHALHSASANERTRQDPNYASWRKVQRHRHRDARLALVMRVHPPQAFKAQCWEDGIEDDVEICRLYLRAQAAQREQKEAVERARRQRQDEREAKRAARVRTAEERAQKAAGRRERAAAKRADAATPRTTPRPVKCVKVERAASTRASATEAPSTPQRGAIQTPTKLCAADTTSFTGADTSPAAAGDACTCMTAAAHTTSQRVHVPNR